MNLGELKAIVRRRLDDTKKKYEWSDDDVVLYLNKAEQEACRRARLITDSSTEEICRMSVVSGESLFEFDPRILYIRRLKLSTETVTLQKWRREDLDATEPGWEDTTGDITRWCPNYETGKIRWIYTPTAAATVNATVIRLPLQDMAADEDVPEIKPHLHLSLVHGALFYLYQNAEIDQRDDTRMAENGDLFTSEFGPPVTGHHELFMHERYGYDEFEGLY